MDLEAEHSLLSLSRHTIRPRANNLGQLIVPNEVRRYA
ncbi:MAG: hypothetical protein K0S45_3404 [Nitrospira sp.]|jgi:hypothetical protein|nr:hypothetical protein [Nitrospira sp.]